MPPGRVSTSNATITDPKVAQAILEAFPDAPEMLDIAICESGASQFNSDGSVVMGGMNDHFVGIFQEHQDWQKVAQPMGLDIYTTEGNIAFARYLLNTYGKSQWECRG